LAARPPVWYVLSMDTPFPLEPFLLDSRVSRLKDIAAHKTRSLTVVLDGLHDPHNISAVLRSSEGLGLLDVHVIESRASFSLRPQVTRGVEKWLDLHRYDEPAACAETLRAQGFQLWAANPPPAGVPLSDIPWEQPIALVFGNEHLGLSKVMKQAATGFFSLTMYGFCQSFNVSVSAGIALALAVREREARLGRHGDLSAEQQAALLEDWQKRSVRASARILAHIKRFENQP
jgi:tRNA (guanosine-2'-O-)-methyltransferase